MTYHPTMERRAVVAAVRLGLVALALVAITAQLVDLALQGTLNSVNYLSYFTIQSSVIGMAALVTAAASWRRGGGASIDMLRGAATVYLTVTLVVFSPLLPGTAVDLSISWVGIVLHGIFPVAVIIDWIVLPPLTQIRFRDSILWLAYPVLWVGFTMLRGPVAGWYPYPLLDPANGGYGAVAGSLAAMLSLGIVLCAVVAALSRRGRLRPSTA